MGEDFETGSSTSVDRRLGELRRRFPRAIVDRYLSLLPTIGERAFLGASAVVVGDVRLSDDVSVWYGAVLRGDLEPVTVGARTNIQDGTVVHVGEDSPCVIGEEVVVGHHAVVHGCTVKDGCLIGIKATILDDAVIGEGTLVGSGALITPGTVIPPHSLVLGVPGRVVRTLTAAEEASHRELAAKYVNLKENYRKDQPG